MLTPEQIELRRTKIAASEIATIGGLNPWETPTELVLRKRGQIEDFAGNTLTRAGQAMETVIAHMVAERTGARLRRSNETLISSDYPWLVGHIDRRYEGQRRGVEIKNVSPHMARNWGADGSDSVPDWYMPQPHAYMLILGWYEWDVAAYFGGADMRMYPIERDVEIQEWVIDTTHDFWVRYINGTDVPEIDPDHPHALDALKTIHRTINKAEVEADERIMHWHKVRMDAKDQIGQLEDVVRSCDVQLLKAFGDAGTLRLPDGSRYERRKVERKGFQVEPMDYIAMKHIKPRKAKDE